MSDLAKKFRGQCPICFTGQEFSTSGLPVAVRCACGSKLIALRTSNLSQIPVHCASCRESYSAEPKDIGKLIACKCGAKIEVLETTFRAPLNTAHEVSREIQPVVQNEKTDSSDRPSTGSFAIVESDLPLVKVRSTTLRKSRSDDIARPASRKKNWPVIAGVLGVIGFLLMSIGAFTFSRFKDKGVAQSNEKKQTVSAPKPAQPFSEQKIPPGMMAKLLKEVPIPQSDTDKTAGPPNKSPGERSKPAKVADKKSEARSPYGGPVPKREIEFPDPVPARPRVHEVPVKQTHRVLSSAYQDMFNSYEKLNAIDEKSKESLSDEYRTALGETLYLCRHALPIAQRDQDKKRSKN